MKTETFKPPVKSYKGYSGAIKTLKPGQAIRIKTAAAWRSFSSQMIAIGKKTGTKFSSANDGEDVLVFIKAKSK